MFVGIPVMYEDMYQQHHRQLNLPTWEVFMRDQDERESRASSHIYLTRLLYANRLEKEVKGRKECILLLF